ncbi:hypothetical protein EUTSA_v10002973mg [Eutrema salsugineum]|uniref:F-box domain-containing protein n=1 Tax=Eutrema salsugineum TaxID=72664 RepID=V4LCQ5_EUTSA|nr:hypothetical protein EUTSA_v10002973mg [Eutrema salsugineum]
MAEQEEKRARIQRATHDDDNDKRSKLDPIPLDLISEILSRLPAKSLVRSLCVSKLWSSLTKHSSFINSFATRSSERPPRNLVTFSVESKRFVFSVPQDRNPDRSFSSMDSYQMTNHKVMRFLLSKSVQGLVLLTGFLIWNPTMRRFLNLSQPKTRNLGMSFLGYDPLEGKHKLLHVDREHSKSAWILTLGAQESWRKISKDMPFCSSFGERCGRCFNGILYYSACFCTHPSGRPLEYHIVRFDVRSEKFNLIKPPKGTFALVDHMMIPYEGRLALVSPTISDDNKVEIYILQDADGQKWTHKRFRVPSMKDTREGRRLSDLRFHDVTDAGEFIFAPKSFSESFYILYFDPRRKSIREEVWFEGISGDEFRRRYGLRDHEIRDLHIFPNHFESIVSCL